MAEHTPTPWMTQRCGELCPDDIMIVADMGVHNGIQHISTVAKALSIRQTAEVTATNAAFIVKACNSFAANEAKIGALVKALGEAITRLEDVADDTGYQLDGDFIKPEDGLIARFRAALLAAREVKP